MRPLPLVAWTLASLALGSGTGAAQDPDETGAATAIPKVAVVVSGDPDAALREPAARLDAALGSRPDVQTPSDPGLRRALRGDGGEPDDGLERARAERRRLGWGEARDVRTLAGIGRMAGADVLVVVRRDVQGPEAVVFHVRAGAFYEGTVALAGASDEAMTRFVLARARLAAGRSTPPPAPAAASTAPAAPPGADVATAAEAPASGEKEAPPKKRWIARNWPYLVAGALLAGTVAYFIARDTTDAPTAPVLRFGLGDGR
jgi:hypothetical protein